MKLFFQFTSRIFARRVGSDDQTRKHAHAEGNLHFFFLSPLICKSCEFNSLLVSSSSEPISIDTKQSIYYSLTVLHFIMHSHLLIHIDENVIPL